MNDSDGGNVVTSWAYNSSSNSANEFGIFMNSRRYEFDFEASDLCFLLWFYEYVLALATSL